MSPTPEQALEALRRILRVHYRSKGLTEICLSCGAEKSSLLSSPIEHADDCDLTLLYQALSPPSAAAVPSEQGSAWVELTKPELDEIISALAASDATNEVKGPLLVELTKLRMVAFYKETAK